MDVVFVGPGFGDPGTSALEPRPQSRILFREGDDTGLEITLGFGEVLVDFGLAIEVEGDCTIDLGSGQQGEVFANGIGRLAPIEGVDDRVERYTGSGYVVASVSALDVLGVHSGIVFIIVECQSPRNPRLNENGVFLEP